MRRLDYVLSDLDDKQYYIKYKNRSSTHVNQYNISLYRPSYTGDPTTHRLGVVIKMDSGWTAVPQDRLYPNTINGFHTINDAVKYMLTEAGHYKKDRTLTAGQLNGQYIGTSVLWYRYTEKDPELIENITMITHKKNGNVIVRSSTSKYNKDYELKWSAVLGEV